ncbi:P-loop containing nucleoside triphosphate hydrolase protein [Pholiota molesta]|nr:P-loop containing nucleoside triphosphate hydrolase protein [Pholiota molesta]
MLAISATGSGKSAYIYMLMHVILAILEEPALCPSVKFPEDPAILVIYPTTALEEDQESKMSMLGLTAKAVNGVTKAEEDKKGSNIWQLVESKITVILLSPEMLTSPGFGQLLDSKKFQARLYAMAIDEVHLLATWGDKFRPAFRQIGFMRARFAKHIVAFAMTATLQPKHLLSICNQIGFKSGNYHLIWHSNARHNIQLIFRTLNASSASERFPQLDWVLNETGKTLIFCPTIRMGFKLAIYLWHLTPRNAINKNMIRLFNSLNSENYNAHTLKLLEGNDTSQITIATDKLSVGVDISDFRTVVIIDPKDLDDLWQKAGRAGRGDASKVPRARVIVYILASTMKAFSAAITSPHANDGNTAETKKRKRAHGEDEVIDSSLRAVVLAACHPTAIDIQYDNPMSNPPCSEACVTCSLCPPLLPPLLCDCSQCVPETSTINSIAPKPRKIQPPLNVRVTQEMRKIGVARLQEFREQLWIDADDASAARPLWNH